MMQRSDQLMSAPGQGLPARLRRHHDRCTPDSCRLAATPKSAESGQELTGPSENDAVWARRSMVLRLQAALLPCSPCDASFTVKNSPSASRVALTEWTMFD